MISVQHSGKGLLPVHVSISWTWDFSSSRIKKLVKIKGDEQIKSLVHELVLNNIPFFKTMNTIRIDNKEN